MSPEAEVEITVVGKRCVYIGDYRVAGGKPYVSENLPQWTFKVPVADILFAVGAGKREIPPPPPVSEEKPS